MCGIFGYVGSEQTDLGTTVLNGLRTLEYRGYDSWGVAVVPKEGKVLVEKNVGKIGQARLSATQAGKVAIGHTRWATHGGVTQANAHPHCDCNEQVVIVHNGIVENFAELKAELVAEGHVFRSETDSEVIAHLIEVQLKQGLRLVDAVKIVFGQLTGMNAILVGQVGNPQLIVVKNGSPIVVGVGEDSTWVSSDVAALAKHTQQVHFLTDQHLAVLEPKNVTLFDLQKAEEVAFVAETLSWQPQQAELGNFPHFMLKEMHEQAAVLRKIAAADLQPLTVIADQVREAKQLVAVACGSAAHCGMIGSYFLRNLSLLHVDVQYGSEAMSRIALLSKGSVVVALSQSGETMDTLEPVKAAQQQGAKVVALVNVVGSTLARQADHVIFLEAGPEQAVASTKAVIAKIARMLQLSLIAANRAHEASTLLQKAAYVVEQLFTTTYEAQLRQLADRLSSAPDTFVIGRGVHYPVALEAALKMKEISYLHAEGMAAGELKHGTLALIEPGVPCLVFFPDDETRPAMVSSAMELKARGAYVIGIGADRPEVCDDFVTVGNAGLASVIPHIVVTQLLSYYLALGKGLDPDKPRNLAKSVTVK